MKENNSKYDVDLFYVEYGLIFSCMNSPTETEETETAEATARETALR